MDRQDKNKMWAAVHSGTAIDEHTAVSILGAGHGELSEILHAAHTVTSRSFGREVSLCSIANVRSGNCSEDCRFCAQSSYYEVASAQIYPLMSNEEMKDCSRKASAAPIEFFSYVTSGRALGPKSLSKLCETVHELEKEESKNPGMAHCASLGCLSYEDLCRLKESGMVRYHHNLETSRSYFPEVCTTHSFDERIRTIRDAKKAGLEVCSGGLLGLGESPAQRVELAMELAEHDVDSIPLNFLIPIAGTPLEHMQPMKPLEILLAIAMFRLTNPHAEVRMAAGRPSLRNLQAFIFPAGCNGLMVGDFLTVHGQGIQDDIQMLEDLGLTPRQRK
jgi:biotin synthase